MSVRLVRLVRLMRLNGVSVAAALVVLAALACLFSYRSWLDGPLPAYRVALALGAITALAFLALWAAAVVPAPLACALAVIVIAPTPLLHAARFAQRHAALNTQLVAPVAYGAAFAPVIDRDASFEPTAGGILLRVPQGSTGYLDVRRLLDWSAGWLWPRALVTSADPRVLEELTFHATVSLDRSYFTLVNTDSINAQVTPFGLLVTAPGPDRQPTATAVSMSGSRDQAHEWSLRRHGGTTQLAVDGTALWSGRDPGPWPTLRVGETKSDAEHGGALHLTALQFVRRLA